MKRKRSLLLLICYGFLATLAVFYGLLEMQSLFVTFLSFHLLVCLGIPLLHALWEGELRTRWRLAWETFDKSGMAYGVLLGVFLFTAIVAGMWLLLHHGVQEERIRFTLERWGLTSAWIGWFALYTVIVNSLLEELLWRGFVLQRLLRGVRRPTAIIVSSFFFALYHLIVGVVLFGLQWGIAVTALVFGAGVLWAWLKGCFPSAYPTWISHLLADLGLMVVLVVWIF
ncbi:CPBP family intramembrane glutamic endopeptidase [Brevibacillus sp. H7]|uniref:CPBP family intramembrane glutamic endopeptidase n=1 Tax=Brevibacillus sp. H7 TaxID=3349138 RepID=UPI0038161745